MADITTAGRDVLDQATILLVDDEPSVLSGLRRSLRGRCVVHTADDPHEALKIAAELPELAVVVSDMRMPGMDGATLLKHMRTTAPDAVRILLTGYTGVEAAVAAINEGAIFRFLWKPCEPAALETCLHDAVVQHRLITAERELLDRTLRGSIRALLETLSLANPLAFSRAERIRARVASILTELPEANSWEVEVAAMLSQLAAVTLPPNVNEHLHQGQPLTPRLQALVEQVPTKSADLLAEVPRLEPVRRSILFQDQRYDGRGPVHHVMAGEDIPLGARILRVAIDFDALEVRGVAARQALTELRAQEGRYDPHILDALERLVTTDGDDQPIDQVGLADLISGMVLADDIMTDDGVMLCGRGQELTQRSIDRVHNWARQYRVVEPISIYIQPQRRDDP